MIERLVRWSLLNRPVVYALSMMLTLFGIYVAARTPVDVLPDLTAPAVTVVVDAGGYTPTEVEQLVTIPLETALNGAPGLRRIRSNSVTGLSVVTMEFDWSTSPVSCRISAYRSISVVPAAAVAFSRHHPARFCPKSKTCTPGRMVVTDLG